MRITRTTAGDKKGEARVHLDGIHPPSRTVIDSTLVWLCHYRSLEFVLYPTCPTGVFRETAKTLIREVKALDSVSVRLAGGEDEKITSQHVELSEVLARIAREDPRIKHVGLIQEKGGAGVGLLPLSPTLEALTLFQVSSSHDMIELPSSVRSVRVHRFSEGLNAFVQALPETVTYLSLGSECAFIPPPRTVQDFAWDPPTLEEGGIDDLAAFLKKKKRGAAENLRSLTLRINVSGSFRITKDQPLLPLAKALAGMTNLECLGIIIDSDELIYSDYEVARIIQAAVGIKELRLEVVRTGLEDVEGRDPVSKRILDVIGAHPTLRDVFVSGPSFAAGGKAKGKEAKPPPLGHSSYSKIMELRKKGMMAAAEEGEPLHKVTASYFLAMMAI
jgi:hypothetical protein